MTYSSRFFLYGPFALLLLLGAGAGVQWWRVTAALEARLEAMRSHEAMPGVTVRYGTLSVGGFPFNVDAVFGDLRVEVATPGGPIVWRAEHFASHALTYGRDGTIFEAAGRQSLSWGAGRRLDFQTGSLHASAIRDAGGLARFDLDLVAFGSRLCTASRLQLHLRRKGAALDVAASGDDVRLPRPGALGDHLKSVMLQGNVSMPRAFDGLRAGRADWQSALEAWRVAHGSLHAAPLEIASDTLDLMGQGQVGLDGASRPAGLIDFKIAGVPAWLRRDPQGAFAAALRARAAAAGGNEAGKLGAVLGAQGGIVYLGDTPLGPIDGVLR
ncbi:MAG: hypothetical protein QOI40_2142 [Alphaproteobacteria bacterium]|jgi:hypothetical protein|nr:hypothetical protein [Alphaproteobacteria bacterium]